MADRTTQDPKCQQVRDRYEEGIKSIRPQVADYWLNHAFIGGNQWLWYNRSASRLESLPRDADRVRATVNRLWPDSRTVISKLTQRDLAFDVLPTSADDASLRGAAIAESVLQDVLIAHDWETIRAENSWATWKGGTAAICVDWDPQAGSPITAVNAQDEDGDPVFEGDTTETPLSIAEFVVEPGARDPERARWWVKALALPPSEVQATYNLKDAPEADATYGTTPFQQKVFGEQFGNELDPTRLTLVLTYYERPNSLCPKGMIRVVVGNEIVHDGPWPFPFKDRLNLAITYETEVETRWTGDTVVTQARPVQVLLNAAWSNITEHMKEAGNARLAVPQSAIDLMDSMTDAPGEMIPFVDGMQAPVWIAPPGMPGWWVDQPERLKDQIDDLLGVHDVSRGKAPVNIESGYGLSILSEQDNTPVGKMAKSAAHAWSRVATMVLELYAHNVKGKRQAIVTEPGQPPQTADWSGDDLAGQTRATVPVDAILPRSRAAQQLLAEKMMQMNLITTMEEFSVVADLPDQKSMIQRMKPDVAKARRENYRMAIGHVCVPAEFDDHNVHITEHNVFRKSERWERLPTDEQEVINEHIKAHEAEAAAAMARSRVDAAIDPALAAVPKADARPSLLPEELPPMALDPLSIPGVVEGVMDDGAMPEMPLDF